MNRNHGAIGSLTGLGLLAAMGLEVMPPPRVAMSEEETKKKAREDREWEEANTLGPSTKSIETHLITPTGWGRRRDSASYDAVGRCPIPIAPRKSDPHGRSEPRKKTVRKGRRS